MYKNILNVLLSDRRGEQFGFRVGRKCWIFFFFFSLRTEKQNEPMTPLLPPEAPPPGQQHLTSYCDINVQLAYTHRGEVWGLWRKTVTAVPFWVVCFFSDQLALKNFFPSHSLHIVASTVVWETAGLTPQTGAVQSKQLHLLHLGALPSVLRVGHTHNPLCPSSGGVMLAGWDWGVIHAETGDLQRWSVSQRGRRQRRGRYTEPL